MQPRSPHHHPHLLTAVVTALILSPASTPVSESSRGDGGGGPSSQAICSSSLPSILWAHKSASKQPACWVLREENQSSESLVGAKLLSTNTTEAGLETASQKKKNKKFLRRTFACSKSHRLNIGRVLLKTVCRMSNPQWSVPTNENWNLKHICFKDTLFLVFVPFCKKLSNSVQHHHGVFD